MLQAKIRQVKQQPQPHEHAGAAATVAASARAAGHAAYVVVPDDSAAVEALIATAIGLFAAIPAVIAYNRFSHQVEKLENNYGNFMEEFSAILHRQAMASQAQQPQA